jgi:lipoprotein-anchoring transpeptidase ErfK/SrfK
MRPSRAIPLFASVLALAFAAAQEPPGPAIEPPADLVLVQDPPKVVPRVLEQAQPETTRIVVSLGRQRAYLYAGDEVAIDTPVSTGKRRGQTPTGDFAVMEKSAAQLSNRHGDFVDAAGNVVRHGVSTRIDPAPSGTAFRVAPAEYYLKLDNDGLALHAGRLPGYPAADTAVRLPADIASLVFQRVREGTPVRIED